MRDYRVGGGEVSISEVWGSGFRAFLGLGLVSRVGFAGFRVRVEGVSRL